MALQTFATAASAIAAAQSNYNVMSGNKTQQANYKRVIRRVTMAETDNTPVIGELTWSLQLGSVEIASGRSVLLGTAGSELPFPDVYQDVMTEVPSGTTVNLFVTNGDAAAAHGAIVGIEWDRQ